MATKLVSLAEVKWTAAISKHEAEITAHNNKQNKTKSQMTQFNKLHFAPKICEKWEKSWQTKSCEGKNAVTTDIQIKILAGLAKEMTTSPYQNRF